MWEERICGGFAASAGALDKLDALLGRRVHDLPALQARSLEELSRGVTVQRARVSADRTSIIVSRGFGVGVRLARSGWCAPACARLCGPRIHRKFPGVSGSESDRRQQAGAVQRIRGRRRFVWHARVSADPASIGTFRFLSRGFRRSRFVVSG